MKVLPRKLTSGYPSSDVVTHTQYFFSSKALLTRSFISSVILIMFRTSRSTGFLRFYHLFKSVQGSRVVNEDSFPRLWVRGELSEEIDKIAVVGRVPRDEIVRVRPVGAPNNPVRRSRDNGPGIRDYFNKWQPEVAMDDRVADLVCAADFHPYMFELQQIQQQLKRRLVQTFRWFHPGDVVDDHGNRHRADALFLFEQTFRVDVQIDRPAEIDNILDAAIEHIELDVAAWPVEQIETHAANAAF